MGLNTLEAQNIIRQIAYLKANVAALQAYFQGREIPGLRIKDISADKISTGTIKATTSISVVDELDVLRAIMGDRGDGNYGLSIFDQNGDVLLDETKIKMQYTFSTFMENSNVNWTAIVGFLNYSTTGGQERNVTTRLDFVKPTNFVVTEATVYYKFQDLLQYGVTNRLANVDILLNPTKSKVTPASGMDYYRFSAGQSIKTGINPNADEFSGSQVFTPTQIAAITNGQNTLIAQQSASSDTAMGFCVLSLVLTGYLESV